MRGRSPKERLSPREAEVFKLTGQGLAVLEIAKKLRLSVKTVETHRAHIKLKLSIPSSIGLLQLATNWVKLNS